MITQLVLKSISVKEYWEWQLGKGAAGKHHKCPFHEDKNPSFSVSDDPAKQGAWLCRATHCGACGPHFIAFHKKKHKFKNDDEAAADIYENLIRPLESPERVDMFHRDLLSNKSILNLLMKERMLTLDTIKREKIGLNTGNERISIPCWVNRTKCLGFRFWKIKSLRTPDDAKIFHDKGMPLILFNGHKLETNLDSETVFIMSSELDALLAQQDGYVACAGMTGEGKIREEWLYLFDNCKVVICMGKDDPTATSNLLNLLATHKPGIPVAVVEFPEADKSIKDYTDYRRANLITKDFLSKFVPSAPATIVKPPKNKKDFLELPIYAIDRSQNIDKYIITKGIVCGVNYKSFQVPQKFHISFETKEGKKTITKIQTYEIEDIRDNLYFIGRKEDEYPKIFKTKLNIKGANIKVVGESPLSIYECIVAPDATQLDTDGEYVQHGAYILGARPGANTRLQFTGKMVSNPFGHGSTFLVTEIKDIGMRDQKLTAEDKVEMILKTKPLQANNKGELWDAVNRLCDDWSARKSRINKRRDLHIANFLTFFSPLRMYTDGKEERGSIQSLVPGDSRTGKSEVAKSFLTTLGVGSFVPGENCTVPGLIGAVQYGPSGTPIVCWGQIVRANGSIVVIEEVSGLEIFDIGKLTDVRSTGVARITKGGNVYEANAACRMLWLSNPRGGGGMGKYAFGVHAVTDLIGNNEDIARFDIILTLSSEEVGIEDVHNLPPRPSKAFVDDRGLNLLLRHIYVQSSINPRWCYLTKQADAMAKSCARKLAEKYHHEIPIFKGEDGHYKLARLASALACLTHHVDQNGRVQVCSWHVEVAMEYLDSIWSKHSCGYDKYSETMTLKGSIDIEKIYEAFTSENRVSPDAYPMVCKLLSQMDAFNTRDFIECLAIDNHSATEVLRYLRSENLVIKDQRNEHSRWSCIPKFRAYLRSYNAKRVMQEV
jgi:hypothetical protein